MTDTDTRTLANLAGEAYGHFERVKRPDDEAKTFTRLKDSAPEWLTDLVRDAHRSGGDLMFPDDWRYDAIHSAIGAIHDADAETEDDLDELSHEFADQHADVYTAARLAWLASHLDRQSYVDQATEEFGAREGGIVEQIGMGQYMEAREVFNSVLRSLLERLED